MTLTSMTGEGNGNLLQCSCLENPGTGEPGGLQSMGSLGVGHDWATWLSVFIFMHWRRKWQPTPVFLPGESQGWGSLVGAVYGVAQSWTWLKRLSSSSSSSCFFDDPMDVGNWIFRSSAFSKSSLSIWKFMIHILLKPGLKSFEHYLACVWDEGSGAWAFSAFPFFGIGMKIYIFQSCDYCWVF